MRISECLIEVPNMPQETGSIFCAIPMDSVWPHKGNICGGDSGGYFGASGVVVGITSFGPEGCDWTYAAFTNVFFFKEWILWACDYCQ